MRAVAMSTMQAEPALHFGSFTLSRARKLLLDGETPVRLGSRALDLLIVLVEQAGEVVSREELEAKVWPRTVVEETSLRAHISALRKALRDGQDGARFISNVPGRGYCFVGAVDTVYPAVDGRALAERDRPRHNLPARLSTMLGRDDIVAALVQMFPTRRLVTITGPGGMGKTTVAIAAAEELVHRYADGARFVDFSSVGDPALVSATVAAAFELSTTSADSTSALCSYLCARHVLIVFDNCEHLLDAIADLGERLLRGAPGVSIVATSREALNAEGEWAYRLGALGTPPESAMLTASQALSFPAVELFVHRAMSLVDGFELSDVDAPVLAELCRRLDGLPLAIEFAAARVDSQGVHGLAAGLDDRLQLLCRGRRTAMPRHRTLRALLDWSFDLLSPDERTVLCRLAIFKTAFSQEAACAVASDTALSPRAVIESIMNLVGKSLICADASSDELLFRQFESTQAYALERLGDGPERAQVLRRHANYMLTLMARSESAVRTLSRAAWKATFCRVIDDVRVALDWSFAPDGDAALGVELSVAALLPVFELGLISEMLDHIQRALAHIHLVSPRPLRSEMRLNAALCMQGGLTNQADREHLELIGRTLELAERVDDGNSRIDAAFGVWGGAFGTGDYPLADRMAQRVGELAQVAMDPSSTLLSLRLRAQTTHFLGNQSQARRLAGLVLRQPDTPMHPGQTSPVPHKVSMNIVLARIAWMSGSPDQAMALAQECVSNAVERTPVAMIQALALAACPIALWRGDDVAARVFADRLRDVARQTSSGYWLEWASLYDWALQRREDGDGIGAPATSGEVPEQFGSVTPKVRDAGATLSEGLADAFVLERVEMGHVGWCAPEVLRATAENLLRRAEPDEARAESILQRSLVLSREQGALSWELRAATSLGRLWLRHGRSRDANDLVSSTLCRFTEGDETVDLRAARQLVDTCEATAMSSSDQAN